jgi:hypothetical protein
MATADMKGVLLGLGNPLLDISARVDRTVLDKYEVCKLFSPSAPVEARSLAACCSRCTSASDVHDPCVQLKNANQILAQEKHLPLYKVRFLCPLCLLTAPCIGLPATFLLTAVPAVTGPELLPLGCRAAASAG